MREVVIVAAARTPIGRFDGALSTVPAVELGGRAIAGALAAAAVPAGAVDVVVMGHVLRAGLGQITARQAAVAAGVPMDVPAETVDKVCLSGMMAISRARDLIRVGDADLVVAGGMESMSRAPYVLDGARTGYRMGDATVVDSMLHDGLTCAFDGCAMGLSTERHQSAASGTAPTRAEQDAWAARSHERAQAAVASGAFDAELVGVEVRERRGGTRTVDADEGIRPGTTVESLAGLRPAFDADGTITAGNASQISDGAAALVLASAERARELGLTPLATITSWATVAGPDASLLLQPANALAAASRRAEVAVADLDVVEINEAFASVALMSAGALGIDEARVNPNGGAVALGHPIGASGARIVVTLVHELLRRGGGRGGAALCGGGGQGDALTLAVG